MSLIAVSGLDMALWDALGKAADLRSSACSAVRRPRCGPITATACG